jgi:hypothetical protein
MNKKINLAHRSIITLAVTTLFITTIIASGEGRIHLGPPESGTWSGSSKWLTGAYGAASTSYDFNDPANGVCAFVISNTVAGKENNADWRCEPFSLGPAAGGARPVTFSFAYKLSDRVAAGNNLHVQLRFFDSTGTNFLGERVYPIGARTGDSAMTNYRTLTMNGIVAPRKARTADITVNANTFEPWVSGTARFDDFSVTTEPRPLLFKVAVGAAVLLGICALTLLLIQLWRRRTGRNPVAAPGHP